jgi:hypothetical protein
VDAPPELAMIRQRAMVLKLWQATLRNYENQRFGHYEDM